VDGEVKRLIDEAYQQALQTVRNNRQLLDEIAVALLERETLDREEVYLLATGKPLPEIKAPEPGPTGSPTGGITAPAPRPESGRGLAAQSRCLPRAALRGRSLQTDRDNGLMDSTAQPRHDEQTRGHGDRATPASPRSRVASSGTLALADLVWRTARGALALDRPRIMGILNVTPDSFADGGLHTTLDAALAHTEQMLEQGADIIDIGGESTRPGAVGVDADLERSRVLPVLREIVRRWPDVLVSLDTVKSEVARAALDEGAATINDVSALRLDRQLQTCARSTLLGSH